MVQILSQSINQSIFMYLVIFNSNLMMIKMYIGIKIVLLKTAIVNALVCAIEKEKERENERERKRKRERE